MSQNQSASEAKKPERRFVMATPRCWKHKKNGQLYKVLPWYQPLEDRSEFDFVGLMKDVMPELFTDDIMGEHDVYRGLVMKAGWLMENQNRMWFGIIGDIEKEFKDIGPWEENKHRQAARFNQGGTVNKPPRKKKKVVRKKK